MREKDTRENTEVFPHTHKELGSYNASINAKSEFALIYESIDVK